MPHVFRELAQYASTGREMREAIMRVVAGKAVRGEFGPGCGCLYSVCAFIHNAPESSLGVQTSYGNIMQPQMWQQFPASQIRRTFRAADWGVKR